MNNNEIRLSILCQYYSALFNGKPYGEDEENFELTDIPKNTINANKIYLMDKNLIGGKKTYHGAEMMVNTSIITAHGMDVVEDIINQSLKELEPNIGAETSKEQSKDMTLKKFHEKYMKVAQICEVVVNIAGKIFSNL